MSAVTVLIKHQDRHLLKKPTCSDQMLAFVLLTSSDKDFQKIIHYGVVCLFLANLYAFFYRSAPQVILEGHYTHASDVWALGITAWELYTSFTIGQDRQELSVPFYDIETEKVNVTAVLNAFQTTFVIIIGRLSQSLVISWLPKAVF